MRKRRLRRLIEAHGAVTARWPECERHAACHLLAEEPELGRALAVARRLDDALDRVVYAPVAGAEARVAAALTDLPDQDRRTARPFGAAFRPEVMRSLWSRAVTLAMASVLGVVIGSSDVGEWISGPVDPEWIALVDGPTPTVGWEP